MPTICFEKDLLDIILQSIQIFSALLVPVVLLGALLIHKANLKLAHKKRKDDLSDRRYEFYKKFEEFWFSDGPCKPYSDMNYHKIQNENIKKGILNQWSLEAELLFKKDIPIFITSLINNNKRDFEPILSHIAFDPIFELKYLHTSFAEYLKYEE
jgi:hypothetical protein